MKTETIPVSAEQNMKPKKKKIKYMINQTLKCVYGVLEQRRENSTNIQVTVNTASSIQEL